VKLAVCVFAVFGAAVVALALWVADVLGEMRAPGDWVGP
jgi:hypothetical protein